ncbi:MAG: hypothetical protein AAFR56_17175 [Chloroflexota bacterium]
MFHQMNRIVLVVVAAALLVPVLTVGAQSENPVSTLTLTESEINTVLRSYSQNQDSDLSVDFRPGQLVVNLVVTGQRGNTTNFGLTLVPLLQNGTLDFDATQLTINELAIPIDDNNQAVASTADSVNRMLAGQTANGYISNIVITDSVMTVEWTSNNPHDPTIDIANGQLSLTYTETGINMMDWVTNPTNPNVEAVFVDLQPGQGVINVIQSVEPTAIAYTIVPRSVNGRVAWSVNAGADAENAVGSTLATVWQAYFNGIYDDGGLIDVTVTDNAIAFTWDISGAARREPGNATGTFTVNEADVNAALAVYTSSELSSLTVDMQNNRIVLNAAGTGGNGQPYTASSTLVPVIAGNNLTWRAESVTVNGFTLDNNALQRAELSDAMTQGLENNSRSAIVTNVQITDTTMTIDVRYR